MIRKAFIAIRPRFKIRKLFFSKNITIEQDVNEEMRVKNQEQNLKIDRLLEIPEIIDLDAKRYFNGNLIICPTPIGNLKDLSIRSYEALTMADIIACEDTRIAGKLFKLLREKDFDKKIEEMVTNEEEDDDLVIFKPNYDENVEINHPNMIGQKRTKRKLSEIKQVNDVIVTKNKAKRLLDKEDSLGFLNKYIEDVDDEEEFERSNNNYNSSDRQTKTTYFAEDDFIYDSSAKNRKKMKKNIYGLEDEFINFIREKVYQSKLKKQRGLLISCHKFNEQERLADLIKLLKAGLKMVLISDAGSPCLSDPGQLFINEAIKQNILIESLPGPSAISLSLTSSGFPADKFNFLGYLSKNTAELTNTIKHAYEERVSVVAFESKFRVNVALGIISRIYGPNQMIYLGVELTKLHERHLRGTVSKVLSILSANPDYTVPSLKGEITIVIAPYQKEFNIDYKVDKKPNDFIEREFTVDIENLIDVMDSNIEMSTKELGDIISKICGINKRQALMLVNDYKNEKG